MYFVVFIAFMIMTLIAVVANFKFKHLERLPMQWGLSGQVNWTAPRVVGLAFIPVLYLLSSSWIIFSSGTKAEAAISKSLIMIAILMIAIQIFHLLLINKKGSH